MANTKKSKSSSTELLPVSDYRLSEIFEKINTKDYRFLKYIPDIFLNDDQIVAKKKALQDDRVDRDRFSHFYLFCNL